MNKENHNFNIVKNPLTKKMVHIDTQITELIQLLWKLGIRTNNSCENNIPTNYIWIEFTHSIDATIFLNIIGKYIYKSKAQKYEENDLYQRIKRPEDEPPNQWLFSCNLLDYSEQIINDETTMNRKFKGFEITISIRFPQEDYSTVVKALQEKIKTVNSVTFKSLQNNFLLCL